MKKIYFVSGFPRAGNTLLASLLSQNPNITATPYTYTPEIFFKIISIVNNSAVYNNFPNFKPINEVLKNVFHNSYAHCKTDYVIERSDWFTPYNMQVLQDYAPNEIKIVILVRDILEIIKSYLILCQQNPDFFINHEYNRLPRSSYYKTEIEDKADVIMAKGGHIDHTLYSIKYMMENHPDIIKFVEYNDLVCDTKNTLDSIYDFYNITRFQHDLNKLDELSLDGVKYNDAVLGAPMHKLRNTSVSLPEHDFQLPESVIHRYSGLEFWRSPK